jgi:DNA-binding XRE family transcriptional regulator
MKDASEQRSETMLTKNDPTEFLQGFPEEFQEFFLAASVLSKRIGSLPKADQDDLVELVFVLNEATDEEERRCTRLAMVEILSKGKIVAKPMSLATTETPRGTDGWAKFVGGKIKEFRTKCDMTQNELAEKAGLPQSHISRLENAEHNATHITLVKIAKALGVEVRDLDPCID